MRRSADYQSDDGRLTIRPNTMEDGKLAYITIFTSTKSVHINQEYLDELMEIVKAIKARYVDQTE